MNLRNLLSGVLMFALVTTGAALFHHAAVTEAWSQDQSGTHTAVGVVKEVDREQKTVTISHGPVESLDWKGMTMSFALMDAALLDDLPVGKDVEFEFMQHGNKFMIVRAK